jgi:phenylalanyl-tRNA synthetase beta chain
MKIAPIWIRDFVSPQADDRAVAEALTVSGVAIEGYYGEGVDAAWEAEITTNRVDAMNHYGVAREVSAIYNLDLKPVAPKLAGERSPADFAIAIEDAEGCARYTARVVRGVTIDRSPKNIAHRLELIDQRSINNVADATNYVLNELGQPTHAFDLDKLEGGKIIVRHAREGEVLKTLDGVERKLTREDLVIADAVKAVALAGIMGGEASMITSETKNVLIESAWFDPATIRRTARRLGMHTDASHRFERGADFSITPVACARVCELIQQTAGGDVSNEIDIVARRVERPRLALHRSEIKRILGVDVPSERVQQMLGRLGFGVTPGQFVSAITSVSGPVATKGTGGSAAAVAEEVADWQVQVPTWRLDVDREIDLIEEVARIFGLGNIPNTLPSFAGAVVELPSAAKASLIRNRLLALGYNESISTTFIPQEEAKVFGGGEAVRLANPLSDEAAYMRTSLLPGLVAQVAYNLNRGNSDVRLFETGDVFELIGDKVEERRRTAFVATGTAGAQGVHSKAKAYDFFDMKGNVESLLEGFDLRNVYYDRVVPEYFHPGRAARVVADGATVARFGQLRPEIVAQRSKSKQDVFAAELLLERLYQHSLREPVYTPIPRYPAVERDFSFIFSREVEFAKISQAVSGLSIPEMVSFAPVEVFEPKPGSPAAKNLGEGNYSLLVRAKFQSSERTLRDEEVNAWSQQIIAALEKLGGRLRG